MSDERKKELEQILNYQRIRFCQEYILNEYVGVKAAIAAGYSAKTAKQKASNLLDIPEVKEYVAILMQERSKRFNIDADWVLEKLVQIVDSNLEDFLVRPADGSQAYFDLSKASREQVSMLESLQIDTSFEKGPVEGAPLVEVRKVKLSLQNKLKALELIGKHINVQAFKEKVELSADADIIRRITAGRARAINDKT